MRRKGRINRRLLGLVLILITAVPAFRCSDSDRSVVIYTSVDQHYSEPILKEFQAKTGIQVRPVFDVEAAKTTGLVNRLIAEQHRPQTDVFWNGEFAQTILLKKKDVLAPYNSPSAQEIPPEYRDPDHYWTGFAARARILIVNTDHLLPEDYPASIFDLLSSRWPGERIGIAYPLFGTTATHAAAIYAAVGRTKAKAFFEDLHSRKVSVVNGNSVVRDLVSSGQLMMGLTDTDDACGAISKGAPVEIVFLDQKQGGLGTLLIPNTVALIKNAPHPIEARILIDFLLSDEVAKKLVASGWSHIPLRPIGVQPGCLKASNVKGMNLSFSDVYGQLQQVKKELTAIFIR